MTKFNLVHLALLLVNVLQLSFSKLVHTFHCNFNSGSIFTLVRIRYLFLWQIQIYQLVCCTGFGTNTSNMLKAVQTSIFWNNKSTEKKHSTTLNKFVYSYIGGRQMFEKFINMEILVFWIFCSFSKSNITSESFVCTKKIKIKIDSCTLVSELKKYMYFLGPN